MTPRTAKERIMKMKIIKSKETLILTQVEKIILSKAKEYLDEIYNKTIDNDMEYWAEGARDNIGFLLEGAEVEEEEPKGEINISILM